MSTETQENTHQAEVIPFFARFLEIQQPEESTEEGLFSFGTMKYPSDSDE